MPHELILSFTYSYKVSFHEHVAHVELIDSRAAALNASRKVYSGQHQCSFVAGANVDLPSLGSNLRVHTRVTHEKRSKKLSLFRLWKNAVANDTCYTVAEQKYQRKKNLSQEAKRHQNGDQCGNQTYPRRRGPTSVILPTITSPVCAVYLEREQSKPYEIKTERNVASDALKLASSHSYHVFSACTEISRFTLFTTPHSVA